MTTVPFRDPQFIDSHIQQLTEFYQTYAIDNQGGFFQSLFPNGQHQDAGKKQLVSSTRLTWVFATAGRHYQRPEWLALAEHGMKYVAEQHFDATRQGFNWVMDGQHPIEQDNYCYGLAFVVLMYAGCLKSGLAGAKEGLYQAFDIMEQRFWQPEHGLYADQASPDWLSLDSYRGQNANMHACEAMIAAYEASQDSQFLQRAITIADNICRRQTATTNGLIWEHYNQNWQVDWEYNKNDPKNLYKPWGFQPGHLTEWAKLLLQINKHSQLDWLVTSAEHLFQQAWQFAWDEQYGGLVYGFDPDGKVCDDDKYFWVQAESLAAAAMLAKVTGNEQYWQHYDQLWQYSWQHFCGEKHQPWWRVLTRDNQVADQLIASPGAKIDYHTIGACFEVLNAIA
ncbi:AGE family epimerase/isomerase [Motilimonas pumila]|uniref:AGE family epimerase/isomerase n=1 Tax=Motilimonas pumila TaxID=2303987 RepID=A0A418YHE5_9GAMM|nr:AGE family epimerase/isomerase [Motilimonas pumila]RJG49511.1 AGE family epimerase/isomerase [Motilimonas pumila]